MLQKRVCLTAGLCVLSSSLLAELQSSTSPSVKETSEDSSAVRGCVCVFESVRGLLVRVNADVPKAVKSPGSQETR